MNPVLGDVAGYPVYVFPVLLNAGIAAGVALALVLLRRRGAGTPGAFLDAAVWVLPAGLLGARLVYAAAHWTEYAASPLAVLSFWEGGLSLPGAITAGLLVAPAALRRQGLPVALCLDAGAAGLALGQALGRLGCLVAGCAAGVAVSPGDALPALALPDSTGLVAARFPSQLAESLADLVLCAVLLGLWARRPRPGTVLAAYLIGYGALRVLAEVLRADGTPLGPLSLGQWWGVGAVAAGCAVLTGLLPRRLGPGRTGAPAAGGSQPAPTYARDG